MEHLSHRQCACGSKNLKKFNIFFVPYLTQAEEGLREGEEIGLKKGEELGLKKGEELGLKKGEELGLKKGEELGLKKGEELGMVYAYYDMNLDTKEIAQKMQLTEGEVTDIIRNREMDKKVNK